MSEDNFNLSMRKFLKSVGVTSQQKIEDAVRAIESNSDLTSLNLTVTLRCDAIGLNHGNFTVYPSFGVYDFCVSVKHLGNPQI